jgi:hypothetical protein
MLLTVDRPLTPRKLLFSLVVKAQAAQRIQHLRFGCVPGSPHFAHREPFSYFFIVFLFFCLCFLVFVFLYVCFFVLFLFLHLFRP